MESRRNIPPIVYKLMLVAATVIWGFAFVVMKDSVDVLPPAQLIGVRFTLTALLMGAEIFGWASLPFLLIAVAAAYAGSYDVGVFGRGAASELARVRRRARRDEPSFEEDR